MASLGLWADWETIRQLFIGITPLGWAVLIANSLALVITAIRVGLGIQKDPLTVWVIWFLLDATTLKSMLAAGTAELLVLTFAVGTLLVCVATLLRMLAGFVARQLIRLFISREDEKDFADAVLHGPQADAAKLVRHGIWQRALQLLERHMSPICFGLALLAIAGWQQTGDPRMAMILCIAAAWIGAIPFFAMLWQKKGDEIMLVTWSLFLLGSSPALVHALLHKPYTLMGIGFEISAFISQVIVVGLLLRGTWPALCGRVRRLAHFARQRISSSAA